MKIVEANAPTEIAQIPLENSFDAITKIHDAIDRSVRKNHRGLTHNAFKLSLIDCVLQAISRKARKPQKK
jgi:hypothetical protein